MAKSQPRIMLEVLRGLLRKRGLRNREIADRLGVSQRTVTRWFTTDCVDTKTVDHLCGLAGITFFALCELAAKRVDERQTRLTLDQEQALARDPLLLFLFAQLRKGWSADEAAREAHLPESRLIGALLQLEKLKLIRLLPGNEIQLCTTKEIEWNPTGAYANAVSAWLARSLDKPHVGETNTVWAVEALKLSKGSISRLQAKFQDLLDEAREFDTMDRRTNNNDQGWYALVLTARPVETRPYTEWKHPGHPAHHAPVRR